MIQRHSIILWRREEEKSKSFDEIAEETFQVLNIFQEYPIELRPNYLSSTSKKNIELFNWNIEEFKEALKKGVNREGREIFDELGYTISFFSSLEEENSTGFQLTVGNKHPEFYNTIIISLPLTLDIFNLSVANMISTLFEDVVGKFVPFWGCISNRAITRKYGKYIEGKLPTTIHWVNYWSEDIINEIGMESINDAISRQSVSIENGILKIRDIPLDAEKEEDRKFHGEVDECILGEKKHKVAHK